jgi:hypothetical protein
MYDTMENVQHKGHGDGAELLAEVENNASSIAYPCYDSLEIMEILHYYASNCNTG